jgi:UDP-glucuronate 4-epimerase
MKILVTGCAGFIGFHLTRRLLAGGYEVVGVDNLNDYYDPALKAARLAELGIGDLPAKYGKTAASGSFRFIYAGIEDPRLYENHLDGQTFDLVCHLAAQAGVRYSIDNPAKYIASNIDGFFLMLEYCRHHKPRRFVYASSSSVYGNSAAVPYRESDRTDSPVSLYAATKKADEAMAHSYASLYGIRSIGLRFFTVYGPWGRPDMAPFIFTRAILSGEPIRVFNGGRLSRDFTYVDDIIEGVVRVLTREPASEEALKAQHIIYNIGNSQPVELEDFISAIEDISGRKAVRQELPMQPGDVLTTWADTTLLNRDYAYRPSTPLREGLGEFIKWYRNFYKV